MNTKTLAETDSAVWTKTLVLTGVATLAPLLGHLNGTQFLTGPIVNATLFISISILSKRQAILIAVLPSLLALSIGLLPLILAPMLPFIIAGNIVLMLSFKKLAKRPFTAVLAASSAKFALLYLSSLFVVNYFLEGKVAVSVAQMITWPQLLTALAGGVLALGVLSFLKTSSASMRK